ncbi:hypothetical protein SGCZBJ_03790 [Caulobacter zeae]|uniref:Terminase n=1 Tax=Caulobacter zeae TaxID=2055137 RepID=A0A2N5DQ06_9CAUL|nr:hypothetical protein [Caulobacter zeae]PLR28139.1 hypothetical protein SGCZBJ_03790 [Caulobacter zeae]
MLMADRKQAIDWAAIEHDFRNGSMSLREMAKWYGVSDGAIRKRAKSGGWERAARPESTHRAPASTNAAGGSPRTALTAAAASPVAIIGRGRNLVLRLLDELEATTCNIGELDAFIVQATGGDQAKQCEALRQATSLKQRSDVLRALALAAKTLSEAGPQVGKKEERNQAAQEVVEAGGIYAPRRGPRLAVDNS